MNFHLPANHVARSQAGMVLLACLLFLTALTLLGLSASADAVLQKQLAANLQETERAKQSALAALSWAENWLLNLEQATPVACMPLCEDLKLHLAGSLLPHPEFENISWWQTQGYEAGIDPLGGSRLASFTTTSASPPMWMIELIHESPASEDGTIKAQAWYRILARGTGHTQRAVSVIESTVTRNWSPDKTEIAPETGRVAWRMLR